jgi:hypothetical protein
MKKIEEASVLTTELGRAKGAAIPSIVLSSEVKKQTSAVRATTSW